MIEKFRNISFKRPYAFTHFVFFYPLKIRNEKGLSKFFFIFTFFIYLAKENYIGPETFFHLRQVSSHWNGMKYAEVYL